MKLCIVVPRMSNIIETKAEKRFKKLIWKCNTVGWLCASYNYQEVNLVGEQVTVCFSEDENLFLKLLFKGMLHMILD